MAILLCRCVLEGIDVHSHLPRNGVTEQSCWRLNLFSTGNVSEEQESGSLKERGISNILKFCLSECWQLVSFLETLGHSTLPGLACPTTLPLQAPTWSIVHLQSQQCGLSHCDTPTPAARLFPSTCEDPVITSGPTQGSEHHVCKFC